MSSWVGQPHASQWKHQGIPATCCLYQVPGITRAEEAASSSPEICKDLGHMQKPANSEGPGQVLKYTCGSPIGVLFSAALDRRVFEGYPWDLEFSPHLKPKVRKVDLLISPGQAASPGSNKGKELKLCLEMDGGGGNGGVGAGEAETPDRSLCRNGRVAAERKPCGGTSLVVQWLRICLPMQVTWVRSLVRELRSHMPQSN